MLYAVRRRRRCRRTSDVLCVNVRLAPHACLCVYPAKIYWTVNREHNTALQPKLYPIHFREIVCNQASFGFISIFSTARPFAAATAARALCSPITKHRVRMYVGYNMLSGRRRRRRRLQQRKNNNLYPYYTELNWQLGFSAHFHILVKIPHISIK